MESVAIAKREIEECEYDASNYIVERTNKINDYLKTHEIPKAFYQCLFGELVKIWGMRLIMPDESYLQALEEPEPYSYHNQLAYFLTMESGTSGWYEALKSSCKQCDLNWLLEDYNNFNWIESDGFDGQLIDKILDAVEEETNANEYYQMLIKESK